MKIADMTYIKNKKLFQQQNKQTDADNFSQQKKISFKSKKKRKLYAGK